MDEAPRTRRRLEFVLGGPERFRVIVLLACVLGLSSADNATVGASAIELRQGLGISNTDIGLLVAVSSIVAAAASVPFGMLADRTRRTMVLGIAVSFWGMAMIWSATVSSFGGLLLTRLVLGVLTAAAGPMVASLVGDFFYSGERGRIYGYVLAGELIGAGVGFAVTGDVAALSWRAAFVILGLPAFVLAWFLFRLPEPARGARAPLYPEPGTRVIVPASDQPGADHAEPTPGGPTPPETDAQRLVREQGIQPDERLVLRRDAWRMGIVAATRYLLSIKTNVILIVAGACGYYFLAGVQTFGVEFVRQQYGVGQVLANLLMILIGAGALIGVLVSGNLADSLLRRGRPSSRILVSAVAAVVTTGVFIPALLTRSVLMSLPYLVIAAFALSAQNPPIDAAPPRHRASTALGQGGGGADAPSHRCAGPRSAAVRRSLRVRLRRRTFGPAVDLRRDVASAGGQRRHSLPGHADLPPRRRDRRRRDPAIGRDHPAGPTLGGREPEPSTSVVGQTVTST